MPLVDTLSVTEVGLVGEESHTKLNGARRDKTSPCHARYQTRSPTGRRANRGIVLTFNTHRMCSYLSSAQFTILWWTSLPTGSIQCQLRLEHGIILFYMESTRTEYLNCTRPMDDNQCLLDHCFDNLNQLLSIPFAHTGVLEFLAYTYWHQSLSRNLFNHIGLAYMDHI